jgi:hypothetical protein
MGMEVRSSTKRAPICGSPKVGYKGVNEVMGLPSVTHQNYSL